MNLENLIAGESRTIEVTAKVAERSAFASDRDFFCVSNYTATAQQDQMEMMTANFASPHE